MARSTFPSQNVQNTPFSDHFWKLTCRQSARRCGRKQISKSKVLKTDGLEALLEIEMSKICTPLWREAHFEVKSEQTTERYGVLLDAQMSFLRGRQKGLCTLSRVNKTKGFCCIFKNDGRRGTFEEDLDRCISRGRGSTRDMFIQIC